MKLKNLYNKYTEHNVKITDFETFFHIFNCDNILSFNLNETLHINIDKKYMNTFKLLHDMFWPLISYKIYDTIHLAWLLMMVNNVTSDNVFDVVPASSVIYYVPNEYLETIIRLILEH